MTRIKNENVSTKLGQTLENDISGNGVIQRIPPPPSSYAMKGLPREDLEVNRINVRSWRSLRLQKESCVLRWYRWFPFKVKVSEALMFLYKMRSLKYVAIT